MSYITVKLTQDQVHEIIKCLEYNQIDNSSGLEVAYEQRIINKLYKALAQAKS